MFIFFSQTDRCCRLHHADLHCCSCSYSVSFWFDHQSIHMIHLCGFWKSFPQLLVYLLWYSFHRPFVLRISSLYLCLFIVSFWCLELIIPMLKFHSSINFEIYFISNGIITTKSAISHKGLFLFLLYVKLLYAYEFLQRILTNFGYHTSVYRLHWATRPYTN